MWALVRGTYGRRLDEGELAAVEGELAVELDGEFLGRAWADDAVLERLACATARLVDERDSGLEEALLGDACWLLAKDACWASLLDLHWASRLARAKTAAFSDSARRRR